MGLRSRAGKVARPRFRQGFSIHIWDKDFPSKIPHFIFQIGLATVSLMIILTVESGLFRAAIVVAVASTAFTIFVFPNSVVSTPRRTIGGHAVAVVCGLTFAALLMIPPLAELARDERIFKDILAALAVGLSMALMVATDTEHPPAAGTALGLVVHGMSVSAVVFILSSAIILSIVRIVLRPRMRNLL
ncbi:MAG: HPP family protein [Chloroflexi bacterium]|nr:HPP family protein [Chloroflexota bacterium]